MGHPVHFSIFEPRGSHNRKSSDVNLIKTGRMTNYCEMAKKPTTTSGYETEDTT